MAEAVSLMLGSEVRGQGACSPAHTRTKALTAAPSYVDKGTFISQTSSLINADNHRPRHTGHGDSWEGGSQSA